MATKISVSFKNNKKEKKLYDYFNNLDDKGNEIKSILNEWYVKNIESNTAK